MTPRMDAGITNDDDNHPLHATSTSGHSATVGVVNTINFHFLYPGEEVLRRWQRLRRIKAFQRHYGIHGVTHSQVLRGLPKTSFQSLGEKGAFGVEDMIVRWW